jgi:hypothetical protein
MGIYGGPDADMPVPNVLRVPQGYPTIQAAIDAAVKGDVIKVSAGTYSETVLLNKSGIILMGDNRNSIIHGEPGLSAIYCEDINNDMTLITGFTIQGLYGVRCASAVSTLRIEDNTINAAETGPVDYGYGVYLEDGASCYIARNNISNCGRAIHGCGNNDNIRIMWNTIDNCRMPHGGGIFLNGTSDPDPAASLSYAHIKYNTISHCLDGAINIRNKVCADIVNNWITENDASDNAAVIESVDSMLLLRNNFIGYNHASGTGNSGVVCRKILSNYVGAYIDNNIFYCNSGANMPNSGSAISFYEMPPNQYLSINSNIFTQNSNAAAVVYSNRYAPFRYDNLWDNTCQGDTVGVEGYCCIAADPLFVSSTDFHLASGSPCIDSGTDSYGYRDLDGTRNDMGIYGGPNPMTD